MFFHKMQGSRHKKQAGQCKHDNGDVVDSEGEEILHDVVPEARRECNNCRARLQRKRHRRMAGSMARLELAQVELARERLQNQEILVQLEKARMELEEMEVLRKRIDALSLSYKILLEEHVTL